MQVSIYFLNPFAHAPRPAVCDWVVGSGDNETYGPDKPCNGPFHDFAMESRPVCLRGLPLPCRWMEEHLLSSPHCAHDEADENEVGHVESLLTSGLVPSSSFHFS